MKQKSIVKKIARDFYSDESREFRLRIGTTLASSLFGLICGVILSSVVWYIALNYIAQILRLIYVK